MKNETVLNHIKNLDNFYYLPNQGNLGDCVIAAATYKLLDDNKFIIAISRDSMRQGSVSYRYEELTKLINKYSL